MRKTKPKSKILFHLWCATWLSGVHDADGHKAWRLDEPLGHGICEECPFHADSRGEFRHGVGCLSDHVLGFS